jgi:glycerophosphoryl diester phosphodiesterase
MPVKRKEGAMPDSLPALNLSSRSRGGRPLLCGHRGARTQAPENTLAGFVRAVELGADLIELDVRLTSDGAMAIMHDATVDRTTNGSGRLAELSWQEVQKLDVGIRFGEAFTGERVPSLADVLEWARGRVYLAVEIKEPAPLPPAVLERIASAIVDAGMADQVTMHHIQQPNLSAVHSVHPAIHVLCDWSATVHDLEDTIRRTRALDGAGVIWDWHAATRDLVATAHAAGLAVYAYDCPSAAAAVREARSRGLDILEADDVGAMAAAIAASAEPSAGTT